MTLKEYANKVYKPYLTSKSKNDKEFRSICGKIDIMCEYPIGELELDKIKKFDVSEFLTVITKSRGISLSTQNRYRSLLSVILSHAMNREIIENNPVFKVGKKKETGRGVYIEREAIERLLTASKQARNKEFYYILSLAIFTGMRRGEILKLDYSYIKDGYIKLPGIVTKSGQSRNVPLNSFAKGILDEFTEGKKREGKVFKSVCIQTAYRNARKRAGISDDVRFHDLRRSFATMLKDKGVDIHSISQLLGHTTVTMTQRYLSSDDAKLKDSSSMMLQGWNTLEKIKNS